MLSCKCGRHSLRSAANIYIDGDTAQAQESTCLASGPAVLVVTTAKTPLVKVCHYNSFM